MIDCITLVGGKNKIGEKEKFHNITFERGKVYSIVGYTGSGKSQLIKDIEELTSGDSITERKVLLKGEYDDEHYKLNHNQNLIAHLGQNMKFLVDMEVSKFIKLHSICRGIDSEDVVKDVIDLANKITLEKIKEGDNLTRLSGGQTRALMIADIALICDSPIVLIDEIENAGIDKIKALELLVSKSKIVLIVTHDPLIALMSHKRILMKNGGVDSILEKSIYEERVLKKLKDINNYTNEIQNKIREGEQL